jgi:pilus assembly protein Flp/PilA
MKKLLHFLQDESGATAIEYGFLVALIVIGVIASIQAIGNNFVSGPLSKVGSAMGSR